MSFRDVVTWNSIIAGYFQAGFVDEAMSIFNSMPLEMRDVVSWNNVLLELVRNGNVKAAHGLLEKLPYGNVVSSTNLLVGYFGTGEVSTAIKLFKLLPDDPDTTVWNVMICGLGENGQGEEGLKFFQCGDINSAVAVFDGMLVRDVVTWSSIVDEAMSIFNCCFLELCWLELIRNGNVKAAHGLDCLRNLDAF